MFVFTTEKMLWVVCMYWERRGAGIFHQGITVTHMYLTGEWFFFLWGNHLCVELCRKEGEDSISDPYHCLRDVVFILLSLSLKGLIGKTLTILWSAQAPPHNTGGSNHNMDSIVIAPYTNYILILLMYVCSESHCFEFCDHRAEITLEREKLYQDLLQIFYWMSKPISGAWCIA